MMFDLDIIPLFCSRLFLSQVERGCSFTLVVVVVVVVVVVIIIIIIGVVSVAVFGGGGGDR